MFLCVSVGGSAWHPWGPGGRPLQEAAVGSGVFRLASLKERVPFSMEATSGNDFTLRNRK